MRSDSRSIYTYFLLYVYTCLQTHICFPTLLCSCTYLVMRRNLPDHALVRDLGYKQGRRGHDHHGGRRPPTLRSITGTNVASHWPSGSALRLRCPTPGDPLLNFTTRYATGPIHPRLHRSLPAPHNKSLSTTRVSGHRDALIARLTLTTVSPSIRTSTLMPSYTTALSHIYTFMRMYVYNPN